MLNVGSSGEEVKLLQQKLIQKGYNCGVTGADGFFGQATYDAVISFQRVNGIQVDGIVGDETWNILNSNNGSIRDAIKRFIKVALNEVGTIEESINITKYGKWFGEDGNEWCAMFVSWCAYKAGILYNLVPKFDYCEDAYNWYKSRGRYRERQSGYIPKPGDVILFHNGKLFNHSGIVERVENNIIYTIEGNVSDSVRRVIHHISEAKIHGYGMNGGNDNRI